MGPETKKAKKEQWNRHNNYHVPAMKNNNSAKTEQKTKMYKVQLIATHTVGNIRLHFYINADIILAAFLKFGEYINNISKVDFLNMAWFCYLIQ